MSTGELIVQLPGTAAPCIGRMGNPGSCDEGGNTGELISPKILITRTPPTKYVCITPTSTLCLNILFLGVFVSKATSMQLKCEAMKSIYYIHSTCIFNPFFATPMRLPLYVLEDRLFWVANREDQTKENEASKFCKR